MGAGCGQAGASRYYLFQVLFQKHKVSVTLPLLSTEALFVSGVGSSMSQVVGQKLTTLSVPPEGGLWGPFVSSHLISSVISFGGVRTKTQSFDLCIDWGRLGTGKLPYKTRDHFESRKPPNNPFRYQRSSISALFELSDVTERRGFVRRRMRDLYGFLIR